MLLQAIDKVLKLLSVHILVALNIWKRNFTCPKNATRFCREGFCSQRRFQSVLAYRNRIKFLHILDELLLEGRGVATSGRPSFTIRVARLKLSRVFYFCF